MQIFTIVDETARIFVTFSTNVILKAFDTTRQAILRFTDKNALWNTNHARHNVPLPVPECLHERWIHSERIAWSTESTHDRRGDLPTDELKQIDVLSTLGRGDELAKKNASCVVVIATMFLGASGGLIIP